MEKTFELSSSMSFLVIDDNEGYRISVSSSLRNLGFWDIQIASTSMQALKILRATPVDLIICERSMPVVDGA
ncbi:MAG: response regulator, partial [Bdellovibrionota bacterium]